MKTRCFKIIQKLFPLRIRLLFISLINVKQLGYIDSIHLWREALEGRNKDVVYELINQVSDEKIKYEAALALLDSKYD